MGDKTLTAIASCDNNMINEALFDHVKVRPTAVLALHNL